MVSPMQIYRNHRQRINGFTLIGLLILIALIGLMSTASLRIGALLQRRDAEQELLHVGSQFRIAFQSYYLMTPMGQRPYPNTLEELIKDPRFPQPVRHLRKLYADPITGKTDWLLLHSPMGGIIGISSRSDAQPIKVTHFSDTDKSFEGKNKYSDWGFFYAPIVGRK